MTCGLFAASCTTDGGIYTDGSQEAPETPGWYAAGVENGRRAVALADPLTRPDRRDRDRAAADPDEMPPRSEIVAALSAAGISTASAGCIYDNLTTGEVADDAKAVFSLLTAGTSPTSAFSAMTALTELDAKTAQNLVVALSPCLETETLLSLLARTGGVDAAQLLGGAGAAGLPALIAALPGADLSNLDPAVLASLAGGQLRPDQLEALRSLLITAMAANEGASGRVDLASLDLSRIDLAELTSQQVVALLAAISRGLSPSQQDQLNTLANIDLRRLNLDIDPSSLTREQVGALLVLVLPYISASFAPPDGGPPPGVDPGEIYIPPDMDLSHINPLYFVPKDNVVAGLAREGVAPAMAGCLYDRLRLIDPQLIGRAFTGDDLTAAGQVLLSVFSCIL